MNDSTSKKATLKIKKIIVSFFKIIVVIALIFLAFEIGRSKLLQNNRYQKSTAASIITNVDNKIQTSNEHELHFISVSNIEEIIKPAAELTSTKYYYKDADTDENYKELFGKKMPFTKSEVVFTYSGTISIGIDMSKIKVKPVDPTKKEIHIQLPEVEILANEIDTSSFDIPYENNSVFNQSNLKRNIDLLNTLKENKANEVMQNNDLLTEAKTNAESVLRLFLESASLTKDYTIVFD